MPREVKSNARLDHLRLPRRLKMRVENEVGAFVEAQRHAFRLDVRNGSRLPEQQMTVGIEDLRLEANLHAAETRAGLGLALARRSFAVDQNICVVHVTLVAGTNLNRLHPARFLNRH